MPEENNAENIPKSEKIPKTAKSKNLNKKTAAIIAVILILFAGNGVMAWQYKKAADAKKQADAKSAELAAKVENLTKELAAAKDTSTDEDSSAATVCTISSELRENIEDSISSKNTAALEGYMASQVNVVFAASEKGGKVTASQAVSDLDYVNSNAEGPWDFSLSTATLDSYKAGFYKSYFEEPAIIGKSDNDYVVAFHLNSGCKIDVVFVAASAELLT